MQLERDAHALFRAALKAADPVEATTRAARTLGRGRFRPRGTGPDAGRLYVLAVGKAAQGMLRGLQRGLGRAPTHAWVVTHTRAKGRSNRITWIQGGHPLPDSGSLRAARGIERALLSSGPNDLWVLLLSGGASSLIAAPRKGSLASLKRYFKDLLTSGLPIEKINARRGPQLRLAQGRLRRLCPGKMVTLAISDVPGDRLSVIGSGPAGARGHIVACARDALSAAARAARARGYRVVNLGVLRGREAREVAVRQMLRALSERGTRGRSNRGVCLISGGELPVTVRGPGRGGRNTEFVLAALLAAAHAARAPGGAHTRPREFAILSAGTDGRDGATPAAGACASHRTRTRGAAQALARNDSYGFFKRAGGLLITGPTGTNVMDFRAILVT